MDPTYGARYRELHERHWWWRAREAVILRELDRLRPGEKWRRALDVGCGDGLFFERLRAYADTVEGVEPDASLLSRSGRSQGTIHEVLFDTSFHPESPYDLILFLDVLEHMPDPVAAVSHAATLLRPGGIVLVTVPAFRHLWTTHDDLNRHVTRYTRGELVRLLSSALAVEKARYFFRWVYPAKVLQRALEAVRRPEPASPRVPPGLVNAAMLAVSRAEEVMLGRIPLPLGSSLLGVARKP